MKPSGVEVRFFGAVCDDCGCRFAVPLLSDFSYGEFIFKGRGVFGYFDATSEPAWDDIDRRLMSQGLVRDPLEDEQRLRMHNVIAAAADTLGGQQLSSQFSCPHCRSYDVSVGVASPGRFHRLPAVTFASYSALNEEQRSALVARLWRDVHVHLRKPAGDFRLGVALVAIFDVLKMYKYGVGDDIRLDILDHLFRDGSATRAEIDRALHHMIQKGWLVENRQPKVRTGGHCLTEQGVYVMNNGPLGV